MLTVAKLLTLVLMLCMCLQAHLQHGCSSRTAPCTACGELVRVTAMEAHHVDTCSDRLVQCQLDGCKERVQAKVRPLLLCITLLFC
jgi:TRAF-type zinc finger